MRKKIMISMPMSGKDFGSLCVEYHNYKGRLMDEGYCVINSLFKAQNTNFEYVNNPVLCLSRAIKAMSKCDVVFFAKGWENARGCKIEHEIAKAYGLEVIYETGLKKKLHELTQKEIADFCKVTQGCVSGWLNGRLTPNLQNGLKLKKLGFSTEIWSDKAKFDEFMQDLQSKKQGTKNE